MTSLFIADLHLDETRPAIVDLFVDFLRNEARTADTLYILGDLFESWVGDDDDSAFARRIAEELHALSTSGVPIHFIAGNRDFLLGEDYARRCGMQLMADATVLELYGKPTVLLHGDVLCTDDRDYQAFRNQVRAAPWQRQFLAMPLAERRAFARKARDASRQHTTHAKDEIMDVNQDAVHEMLRARGVHTMIHGHTHRPATHRFRHDDNAAERIVLGDWYHHGSVLRLAADHCSLDEMSLEGQRT